ncbi:MAG: hypothetical protein ACFFB5_10390 [Promethearchaeota archaeon]
MSEKGFLSRFTWREYLLVGGLLIIWATAAFFSFQAFSNDDINTVGWILFLGVICTGALLIIIALVERIF